MSQTDESIGVALTRLRGEKSQQWVADKMREQGWKWTQTTVWNVERGERPLRLAEARDLAQILGSWVDFFLMDDAGQDFETANRAMLQAEKDLGEAVKNYERCRARLRLIAKQSGDKLIEHHRDQIQLWESSPPQSVLDEINAHQEAMRFEDSLIAQQASARLGEAIPAEGDKQDGK